MGVYSDNSLKYLLIITKEISQMASLDEQILRTAKEIVVKFIEGGRITPTGFAETFRNVYQTVDDTVRGPVRESSEKTT